jgi:hypothetical protein
MDEVLAFIKKCKDGQYGKLLSALDITDLKIVDTAKGLVLNIFFLFEGKEFNALWFEDGTITMDDYTRAYMLGEAIEHEPQNR